MQGPIISLISKMNRSTTAARIGWVTDLPANARVDYGTTTSYGSNSTDSSFLHKHAIFLSGLTANTTYHFKITSVDEDGNSVATGDLTFSTYPNTSPPVALSSTDGASGKGGQGGTGAAAANYDDDPGVCIDAADTAIVTLGLL